MKLERAETIMNSWGVFNVTYKGSSVWIQDIQETSATAHVKDMETGELNEVPITDLREE